MNSFQTQKAAYLLSKEFEKFLLEVGVSSPGHLFNSMDKYYRELKVFYDEFEFYVIFELEDPNKVKDTLENFKVKLRALYHNIKFS